LIDGAGTLAWAAAHSAYGAVIASESDDRTVDSPFRLLGQVNDPDAELTWTRFRCFDAETGTWISTDPLGLRGGLAPYTFEGSPETHVDPLGLAGNPHPDNRDFKSREEAKAAAYERAGIPPGTEPDATWEVGGDPKRRGEKGYVYSEDKGAQGRYEQFETEQGSRVVAEHTNDGKPHFHAGQPKGDPSRDAVDFGWGGNRDASERYQQVDGKHHYYYPEG
jgi:RHS repeat-associated protein